MLNNADKPPIEELHQFLEFQLPRQWAPVYGDLPLGLRRRKQASPSLQFSFLGPKLYVNTTQVTFWVVHSKIGHTTHFKLLLGTEPRISRCLTQKTSLLGEDTCLVNSRNSFLLANVRQLNIFLWFFNCGKKHRFFILMNDDAHKDSFQNLYYELITLTHPYQLWRHVKFQCQSGHSRYYALSNFWVLNVSLLFCFCRLVTLWVYFRF